MRDQYTNWLIIWLTDWLIDWLTDWLIELLLCWLSEWLVSLLIYINWLSGWCSGWLKLRRSVVCGVWCVVCMLVFFSFKHFLSIFMWCNVMWCHMIWCHVMRCHVIWYHVMSSHDVFCHGMHNWHREERWESKDHSSYHHYQQQYNEEDREGEKKRRRQSPAYLAVKARVLMEWNRKDKVRRRERKREKGKQVTGLLRVQAATHTQLCFAWNENKKNKII